MSAIGAILVGVAAKVGAELVGKALGDRFGPAGGKLTEVVIGEIATRVGVHPAELPEMAGSDPKAVEAAVKDVETTMPELIELWAKGLDGQFALLQAEQAEGFIQSAWRWGWMYLLAVFWTCYVLVFPVLAAFDVAIERVDAAILLTLTTWFISLYMGGHTVKALGESAIDAVKSWRGR